MDWIGVTDVCCIALLIVLVVVVAVVATAAAAAVAALPLGHICARLQIRWPLRKK